MTYSPVKVAPEVVEEVLTKPDAQISIETAYKWCQRAIVAYSQFGKTGELEWLLRGEDYRHEALEHAALVSDGGRLVAHLLDAIERVRASLPVPHACCVCR